MGDVSVKLGKRIKELRENRKLSQLQLAEIVNMEASNLSKIERGIQMPKEESLIKIASALNVRIVDLFDYEHFNNKDFLLKSIIKILNNSDYSALQKFYKILTNM